MRVPWKYIGLAGAAGVAATGVAVARRRRSQVELDADELRERLHERLAGAASGNGVGVTPDAPAGAET